MKYWGFLKNKLLLILGSAIGLLLFYVQFLKNKALRKDAKITRVATKYKNRANEALIKGVQNEASKSSTRDHDFNK